MDSTENGQNDGVPSETETSDLIPDDFSEQSSRRAAEDIGSPEYVKNAGWRHGQKLDFSNILPGLDLIKKSLEEAVATQKQELARLQGQVSKFNK